MDANGVLALGLGVTPPWRLAGQLFDTGKQPHELRLELAADRGSLFPCAACGMPCKAHDFAGFSWRHLDFFEHRCHVVAHVPRTDCAAHGVLRTIVPWARKGSHFTLPFERAALLLACEMPVLAAARMIGITDQRLWRILEHYAGDAVGRLDLEGLAGIAHGKSAARRRHNHVTVFMDLDRRDNAVAFVTPGRGKPTAARFRAFLAQHGATPGRLVEVVCDIGGGFTALTPQAPHRHRGPRSAPHPAT